MDSKDEVLSLMHGTFLQQPNKEHPIAFSPGYLPTAYRQVLSVDITGLP